MDCLYVKDLNGERKKKTYYQIGQSVLFSSPPSFKCSFFFFSPLPLSSVGMETSLQRQSPGQNASLKFSNFCFEFLPYSRRSNIKVTYK